MVTTRRQHPVAVSRLSELEQNKLTPLPTLPDPATSDYGDRSIEENETIGSRLRKRRRTGSSPSEVTTQTSRATSAKKIASPSNKRTPNEATLPDISQNTHQIALEQSIPKKSPQPATSFPNRNGANQTLSENPVIPDPHAVEDTEQSHVSQETPPEPLAKPQQRPSNAAVTPEMQAVIKRIVHHSEHVDNHYAAQGYNEMGIVDTESFLPLGASLHLKTQSLPILDNLATQILNTLAKSTYEEILTIATDPESDTGQAYARLKSLFDHTKKVYSITEPFLSPYLLGPNTEQAHVDTIRKANLATFVSSVFGSQDVGFYHLNEYFLDTFVADGGRLLKSQAQLFLDLKTQAYLSALSHGERSREEILEDLFPVDLDERLLSRRPGAKQLVPSEADFLLRARNRSRALLEEPMTQEAIAALPQKYIWEDFLRDVSGYVSKHFVPFLGTPFRKPPRPGRSNFFITDQQQQQHLQRQQQIQQNRQVQQPDPLPQDVPQPSTEIPSQPKAQVTNDTDDIVEKAARAARFAMQGFGQDVVAPIPQLHQAPNHLPNHVPQHHIPNPVQQQMQGLGQNPVPPHPQNPQYHFEPQPAPLPYYHQAPFPPNQHIPSPMNQQFVNINQQHQAYADQNAIPYPTQSAPTQVLYERARMAATAKASPSNRRAGHPSQRRPWTTEEENSLMAGLDRVKGPHWSQILAMFGPGGTINETLKDRNQVQLKDKARNLKLFFLKSGIEVPYYLQFVTGELKTRAPAQAMKNEQRDQSLGGEDRAHVEGVMALAGGSMQSPDQAASGTEDEVGDVKEHDLSTEGIEGETSDQHGDLRPSDMEANNALVGNEQQNRVENPHEAFAQAGEVPVSSRANYHDMVSEIATRGYGAPPKEIDPEAP